MGLRALYSSSLSASLKMAGNYSDACSNPDVQSGSRVITVWYPCSPSNPNG